MRATRSTLPLLAFLTVLAAFAFISTFTAACSNSNGVTSPNTVTITTSGANVDGAWAGSYTANDPGRCASSAASATFTQNGNVVTGIIKTSNCGVAGSFKGRVDGDTLVGLIDMTGCVGGGVTGTMAGSELRLSIGDMTKPLITGDTVIMTGGYVNLRR
jgi:hypothetical protein